MSTGGGATDLNLRGVGDVTADRTMSMGMTDEARRKFSEISDITVQVNLAHKPTGPKVEDPKEIREIKGTPGITDQAYAQGNVLRDSPSPFKVSQNDSIFTFGFDLLNKLGEARAPERQQPELEQAPSLENVPRPRMTLASGPVSPFGNA